MSWNKPIEKKVESDKKVERRGGGGQWTLSSSSKRGLIAGLVVVLVGGLSAWFILGRDRAPSAPQSDESASSSQITEVKPHVVTNTPVAKAKKYSELTNDEKLKYYRDKYGDNLPENLKPIVYYLENPPKRNFTPPKRPESIFKRHSERTIAAFLNVEPGTWVMKPIEFGARFDADLAAALNEQIEFADADTDEQRELKQAVIDAKAELAERIRNGEKASDVMTETSRQLYELGQYKRDLEKQIAAVRRNENYTDQDVEDFVTAANQMLEQKGLKPIRMPNMLLRRVGLKRQAQKAAQKAAEKSNQEETK